MFGYVIPLKGELKVREYEVFRSYYCGLCGAIGDRSNISRFTLTYDMTFLGLLLSAVYLERETTTKRLCPYKMKKVTSINTNTYMDYAAEMNIILANRKLMDDYNDDRNYFALIFSKFIRIKKPTELSLEKMKVIDENLARLNAAEKSGKVGIDEAAHSFAQLTSELFNVGEKRELLSEIGYNLGKWIYTIDAYDDIEEDIKKGRYNPCLVSFGYQGEEVSVFKNRIRDNMQFSLIRCLDEMSRLLNIVETKKNRGILENIIYLGLERTTMSRFEGGCNHEKSLCGIRSKRRCITGGDRASL